MVKIKVLVLYYAGYLDENLFEGVTKRDEKNVRVRWRRRSILSTTDLASLFWLFAWHQPICSHEHISSLIQCLVGTHSELVFLMLSNNG